MFLIKSLIWCIVLSCVRLLTNVVVKMSVLSVSFGGGAGPCILALWNPLLIIFAGYRHCNNQSFSSLNLKLICFSSETNATIFLRDYKEDCSSHVEGGDCGIRDKNDN